VTPPFTNDASTTAVAVALEAFASIGRVDVERFPGLRPLPGAASLLAGGSALFTSEDLTPWVSPGSRVFVGGAGPFVVASATPGRLALAAPFVDATLALDLARIELWAGGWSWQITLLVFDGDLRTFAALPLVAPQWLFLSNRAHIQVQHHRAPRQSLMPVS
jgi:hypothetical protein